MIDRELIAKRLELQDVGRQQAQNEVLFTVTFTFTLKFI